MGIAAQQHPGTAWRTGHCGHALPLGRVRDSVERGDRASRARRAGAPADFPLRRVAARDHTLAQHRFLGEVRQGKLIELELAETDAARARERVEAMCRELLANPVIEDYAIEFSP